MGADDLKKKQRTNQGSSNQTTVESEHAHMSTEWLDTPSSLVTTLSSPSETERMEQDTSTQPKTANASESFEPVDLLSSQAYSSHGCNNPTPVLLASGNNDVSKDDQNSTSILHAPTVSSSSADSAMQPRTLFVNGDSEYEHAIVISDDTEHGEYEHAIVISDNNPNRGDVGGVEEDDSTMVPLPSDTRRMLVVNDASESNTHVTATKSSSTASSAAAEASERGTASLPDRQCNMNSSILHAPTVSSSSADSAMGDVGGVEEEVGEEEKEVVEEEEDATKSSSASSSAAAAEEASEGDTESLRDREYYMNSSILHAPTVSSSSADSAMEPRTLIVNGDSEYEHAIVISDDNPNWGDVGGVEEDYFAMVPLHSDTRRMLVVNDAEQSYYFFQTFSLASRFFTLCLLGLFLFLSNHRLWTLNDKISSSSLRSSKQNFGPAFYREDGSFLSAITFDASHPSQIDIVHLCEPYLQWLNMKGSDLEVLRAYGWDIENAYSKYIRSIDSEYKQMLKDIQMLSSFRSFLNVSVLTSLSSFGDCTMKISLPSPLIADTEVRAQFNQHTTLYESLCRTAQMLTTNIPEIIERMQLGIFMQHRIIPSSSLPVSWGNNNSISEEEIDIAPRMIRFKQVEYIEYINHACRSPSTRKLRKVASFGNIDEWIYKTRVKTFDEVNILKDFYGSFILSLSRLQYPSACVNQAPVSESSIGNFTHIETLFSNFNDAYLRRCEMMVQLESLRKLIDDML